MWSVVGSHSDFSSGLGSCGNSALADAGQGVATSRDASNELNKSSKASTSYQQMSL
jgi:hypothetical protein